MKKPYWLALASFGIVAAAPTASSIFADIGAQIQGPLKELEAIEQQDKDLTRSEEAQIFASEAEKKQRTRIEGEIAQLQREGDEADRLRQRIIDSGCPPEGGLAPMEVVNRCNPQVQAHRALVEQLTARIAPLKTQLDQVNELRDNISATVLANVQKRKHIMAERERLTAERDRLQALAIAELIKRNKLGAARACKSECCHRVIYDGADPKLCGIGLVCGSFQSAGLFGSGNRICGPGPSATPIREASTPASTGSSTGAGTATSGKTKKQWEIEYEQKLAAYQQELARQQQAVDQYQRDVAEMERKRALLKAQAEQAKAAWERAVAACRAGDYSQCGGR